MIASALKMYFLALILFCGPSGLAKASPQENLDHDIYAMPLLIYNDTAEKFQLNKDSLNHLKLLPAPIKVISAVGDARIGKSNAMSILATLIKKGDTIRYSTRDMPEIFQVCNTLEACTKGVWMHIVSFEKMNYVLLDVEGTNLGDESITTTLSLLTAFLSSDIFLFVKETMNNHPIKFLYHMARRREAQFSHLDRINFANLTIIVRDPLQSAEGKSLEKFFIDSISNSSKGDSMDESRKVIGTQFPPEFIKVKELPIVDKRFKRNIATFMEHIEYRETLEALANECTETLEEKRSIKGGRMDGNSIADVAQSILDMIRSDEWENWESDWTMFERMLCQRSFDRHILPVDKLDDPLAILMALPQAAKNFDEECALKDEVHKGAALIDRKLEMLTAKEDVEKERERAENAEEQAQQANDERDLALADKNRSEQMAKQLSTELRQKGYDVDVLKRQFQMMEQQLVEMRNEGRSQSGGFFSKIGKFFDKLLRLI